MAEKRKFLLRIDAGLWNDLQTWAADELRSVNGQIEYILRQAVRTRRRPSGPARNEDGSDKASRGHPM